MSTYRTISHLTEASIRLNYSAPSSPMWLAYDCGCRHISRLDGSSQWNLCAYHEGFEDGIDVAAIEAERDGAR